MVNLMDFKSIQCFNCTTGTGTMKHDVHQHLIVIYIYFKFPEIRLRGYLVMSNYMDFKSIQGL